MKRILLFLVTNLAVIVLLGIVLRLLGVERILDEQGVGLDYGNPDARPAFYGYLWIAHGWLYFLYLIAGVDLAFRVRYSVVRTLLTTPILVAPVVAAVMWRFMYQPDFGICVGCDNPIPSGRIVLMPEATRCVPCSEKG